MLDTPDQTDDAIGILLAQVEGSYWLLEGEQHLEALLAGKGLYPTPVHCLRFPSAFDLMTELPAGLTLDALWSVHPKVIERLKRNDELLSAVVPPQSE